MGLDLILYKETQYACGQFWVWCELPTSQHNSIAPEAPRSWVQIPPSTTPESCNLARIGALDGGPQCHLSILRNGNVPCRYF